MTRYIGQMLTPEEVYKGTPSVLKSREKLLELDKNPPVFFHVFVLISIRMATKQFPPPHVSFYCCIIPYVSNFEPVMVVMQNTISVFHVFDNSPHHNLAEHM